MGCTSCRQKYDALKASRQSQRNVQPVDANSPRNLKPTRRGIIRKADKPVEVPVVEKPVEENTNADTN